MSKLLRIKRKIQTKIPIGREVFGIKGKTRRQKRRLRTDAHAIRTAERKIGEGLMRRKDCKAGSGETKKKESAPERKKRLQKLRLQRLKKNRDARNRDRRKKGTDRRIDSMPRPPLRRHFQRRGLINTHERVVEDHELTTHIDKKRTDNLKDVTSVKNFHADMGTETRNINLSRQQMTDKIAAARRRSRGTR